MEIPTTILIDFDGVFNPINYPDLLDRELDDLSWEVRGDSFSVKISRSIFQAMVDISQADHVEVIWCSTWSETPEELNAILVNLIGPGSDEHFSFIPVRGYIPRWKAETAYHYGARGRTIWIDDDALFNVEALPVEKRNPPSRLFTIIPDVEWGLTTDHIAEIKRIIALPAGAR